MAPRQPPAAAGQQSAVGSAFVQAAQAVLEMQRNAEDNLRAAAAGNADWQRWGREAVQMMVAYLQQQWLVASEAAVRTALHAGQMLRLNSTCLPPPMHSTTALNLPPHPPMLRVLCATPSCSYRQAAESESNDHTALGRPIPLLLLGFGAANGRRSLATELVRQVGLPRGCCCFAVGRQPHGAV